MTRRAIPNPTFEGDFTFAAAERFELEGGGHLQPVTLHYARYGELNNRRDNAVLVCHALSGSARVGDWWPEMFGANGVFDTNRYCVIGSNVIGSCYGSTGPDTFDPKTGATYGPDFPLLSIADMVRAQAQLLDFLGVEKLHAVVGGSIGGMQALQWAVDFPDRIENCLAIGATSLSSLGLALNHLQRQAIRSDPFWKDGRYQPDQPPLEGLALARSIAICSYKSPELFNERFARKPNRSGEDPATSMTGRYDISGYLDYQGESFTKRFDANSYLVLSKAMDNFDLARDYGSEAAALRRIRARVALIGISSDWLFPATDILALTDRLQRADVDACYRELISPHGHDAFLADAALLAPLLRSHLSEQSVTTVASARG